MKNPLISVIIPVYNAEKYLAMTLQSLQQQTVKDFEAICINDGSSDASLQILQDFAQKDKRFKVFTQQNSGGSVSRNKGLSLAKGQYIAFLDNDDIYHPQYLEILYANLGATNADVSCCSYVRFLGDKTYEFAEQKIVPQIDFVAELPFIDKFVKRKKIDTLMWVKLYKRELFDNIKFSASLPAINDMLLNIEILLKAKKVVVTKDKLIAYRITNTSQTMKPLSAARIKEYENLPMEINQLAVEYPQYTKELRKLATRYAYGTCIKEYLERYNPEQDVENYEKLRKVIQNLMQRGVIAINSLSWRRRLIIWAFLHYKFKLLHYISE